MTTINVLLDNVRSMHNVGSFFRTCDGAGVSELILTGFTPTPPRKEISKTALDSEQSVKWSYAEDAVAKILELKKEGYQIVSVEKTDQSVDFREVSFENNEKVCFIFGNEIEGVSKEVLKNSDLIIHLPMLGIKESLNVSICGGIIIYYYLGDES